MQLGPPNSGSISTISGGMCPNQNYTIVASGPPGTIFSNWTASGNFSINGNGNTANISTYSSFNGGHVTVTLTNACTGSYLASQTLQYGYNCPNSLTSEEVNIYPNPVNESDLTIEWPESAEVTSVNLIDGFAQTIQTIQPKNNKVKFKIDNLPKGDYFIHLYIKDEIIRKRIIKE